MKYSFVVPAYKDTFLKEALDSILMQTFTDFELIVVNDCSPYNLDAILEQYTDSRLRYVKNERNLGRKDLVKSWMHAVSFATGEYLIVASDDDVYAPDFLAQAEELLERHPGCELIRGRVARINDRGELRDVECRFEELLSFEDFPYYLLTHGILCAANYIYHREAFLTNGGYVNFPCAWFTDIATPMVMARRGVLNTPGLVYSFRHSDIQLTTDNNLRLLRQKLDAMMQSFEWCKLFFGNMNEAPLKAPGHYNTRLHLVDTVKDHMRHVSMLHLGMWWRYVFRNPHLFGYEKLEAVALRLINLTR